MTLKRLENGEIYFGNAKWTPEGNISCLVQIAETDEVVEFLATPYDPEAYGVELFNMLSTTYSDQVGVVSEQEQWDYAATNALDRRSSELRQSDWIANSDIQLENHLEWMQYRQDLRDITLQSGYPYTIEWPTKPSVTKVTPTTEGVTSAS